MKVIIAGSRTVRQYRLVKEAILESEFDITEVVSGHAQGVDVLGELWAQENSILVSQFIPDWENLGKRAGFERNFDMAVYADALIAISMNWSKGTANMIELAEEEARLRPFPIYIMEIW